jgi:hypothetical protein
MIWRHRTWRAGVWEGDVMYTFHTSFDPPPIRAITTLHTFAELMTVATGSGLSLGMPSWCSRMNCVTIELLRSVSRIRSATRSVSVAWCVRFSIVQMYEVMRGVLGMAKNVTSFVDQHPCASIVSMAAAGISVTRKHHGIPYLPAGFTATGGATVGSGHPQTRAMVLAMAWTVGPASDL